MKFVDPGMVYGVMMARTHGRIVMRMADADVLPHRFGDFADTIGQYVSEVHKLADDSRKRAETLQRLLEQKAFKVAGDPTKTVVPPKDEGAVPAIEFAKLDNALAKLKKSAQAYDAALGSINTASPQQLAQVNAILTTADRALLDPKGLPGRPWYTSLIYAPGLQTGYGVKTLPGVREAIENKKWDEANQYAAMTAAVLDNYADRIAKAAAALKHEPVTE
jgi:N-acetylated-alpha-linked acidic dipeptidase